MNLIFLCLLCIGVTCVQGQCDTAYPEGCYDIFNIAYITCKDDKSCECAPDQAAAPCKDLFAGTAADMNADKCLDLCKSVDSCAFYRWEETFGLEHCSLMNDNQCQSYEPCSGEHCESGSNGCPAGGNPVGKKCNAGATFTHGRIHWKCIKPNDADQTRINIYQADPLQIIEPGTICYTERKCAEFDVSKDDEKDPPFLYHTYAVQCNGQPDTGEIGKWEMFPGSTNDPDLYINGGTLRDPPCNFAPEDDLVLDRAVLTESGVSFICSEETTVNWGDPDVTVTKCSDCSCALLCNFHHAMTIEPKFQEDEGVSKWWKYSTVEGVQKEEAATKDNVFCWEAPAM